MQTFTVICVLFWLITWPMMRQVDKEINSPSSDNSGCFVAFGCLVAIVYVVSGLGALGGALYLVIQWINT